MEAAKTRRDKGIAVITTTLALITTMMMAGLGFDVGIMYLIRTKLQGAVDAAALATVRNLAQGADTTTAELLGNEFLSANFPGGYWNAQPLWDSKTPTSAINVSLLDQNGNSGIAGSTATTKLVTINAGVTAPLYFLRIVGQNTATINVTAQAKREGLVIMLVLDGSGSMQTTPVGSTSTACKIAQADAEAFLGYSQWDPDIDRMGLVAFGGNTYVVPPIANFQSPRGTTNLSSTVYTALAGFDCHGNTNTEEALQQTYSAIQSFYGGAGVKPNRASAVVLMTDGAPNGFTVNWAPVLVAKSKCAPAASNPSMTGYVAADGDPAKGPRIFNGINNVGQATSAAMAGTGTIAYSGTCAMQNNQVWSSDFTQIPATTTYGDLLTGSDPVSHRQTYLPTTSTLFSSTTPPLESAADDQQVRDLSSNAADWAAYRMRTDPTPLRVTIYTVAVDGNSGTNKYDFLDPTLLQRIANDPAYLSKSVYDPTQPTGGYFYAHDARDLSSEFMAVASRITARLSK